MVQIRIPSLILISTSLFFLSILNCKTSGNYIPRTNESIDLSSVLIQAQDASTSLELKLDQSGNSYIDLEITTNNSGLNLLQMIQSGEIVFHKLVLLDSTGKEIARQNLLASKSAKPDSKFSQRLIIPTAIQDGPYSAHLELLLIDPIVQELCLNSGSDCPRIKSEILKDLKKNNLLAEDGCSSVSNCQSQYKSSINRLNKEKDTYPYDSVTLNGNLIQYREWNLVSRSSYFSIKVRPEVKSKKFDDSDFKEAPPRTPEKKIDSIQEQNIFRKKKGF
ncbi:MAG: hypothetical protein MH321_17440 [Leptospiraceae bacterium]|nr:hypothetical protein [Leptospiraceae bacterium]